MLSEICAEIKNYFTYDKDKHIGDWTIKDGVITPSIDFPTDYIRIVGSHLNDGVHKLSDESDVLADETFHGAIWIMSIPNDFLALVEEIESWQEANGNINSSNMSPFQSESFGGYSYTKGMNISSGNSANTSTAVTWQGQYLNRLKFYRRIRV